MTDEYGRGTYRKGKVNTVAKPVGKKKEGAHGPVFCGHIEYSPGISFGTINHMAVVVHGTH